MARRVPIELQQVDAPLTASATFLVLSVNTSPEAIKTVRSTLAGIDGLSKNVSIRDLGASFACTVGIGSDIWDHLTGLPRPTELHPFREVKGAKHTAVSTPGDLLFHIRSERRDLCFEFERQLLDILGDAVTVVDETVGFRYFDVRDLLGFVDGTANPTGPSVQDSIVVTAEEDAQAAGGSYVVVQKYVHDLAAWRRLKTEQQEAIIGRTKLDNMEFIGYSKELWVIERMLERMFVGSPPGLHDRLLDFSRPLTGTTFFVPSATLLAGLDED